MEITDFTIKLFFILIPGTIASLLIEQLTSHKKWSQFQFILYSILLGIFSYIILQVAYYIKEEFVVHCNCDCYEDSLSVWQVLFSKSMELSYIEIIWASLISIFIAFLITPIIQYGWINKIGRYFKVTNKFGNESLFYRFLSSKEVNWIYLRDKSKGLTFLGQVERYSEDDKVKEISLLDVTVFGYEDSKEYYSLDRVLLTYSIDEELQIEIAYNASNIN